MGALLLLFVCLVLGVLVARFAHPPAGIVAGINWWVLNVALPALVLAMIPQVDFNPQTWFLVAAMWVTFFGAWLLFATLGRVLGWSRQRVGALVLLCGLGNTSFIGYPMVEALRGKSGLALAVVADQLGAFPLLAAGGIVVASIYAGKRTSVALVTRRIVTFPAFIALIVGLIVGAMDRSWPPMLEDTLLQLGQTLTPLALFSVGLQLKLQLRREQLGPLIAGLGWKLALAPLACVLLAGFTGVHGPTLAVGVLQAAASPMISASILADQYKLEPSLANAVLGVGIVLALFTVPLANVLLR